MERTKMKTSGQVNEQVECTGSTGGALDETMRSVAPTLHPARQVADLHPPPFTQVALFPLSASTSAPRKRLLGMRRCRRAGEGRIGGVGEDASALPRYCTQGACRQHTTMDETVTRPLLSERVASGVGPSRPTHMNVVRVENKSGPAHYALHSALVGLSEHSRHVGIPFVAVCAARTWPRHRDATLPWRHVLDGRPARPGCQRTLVVASGIALRSFVLWGEPGHSTGGTGNLLRRFGSFDAGRDAGTCSRVAAGAG